MFEILNRILHKRGVTLDELDKEERKTFEEWQAVLSKEELTVKDIKNFCEQQLAIIENKWGDYGLEQARKAELIPYHHIYSTLKKVVDSPKQIRESLEKNLQQLL